MTQTNETFQSGRKLLSRTGGKRLSRRLLGGIPFLLLMLLFVVLSNRVGLLQKLETTVIDTQMRLNAPLEESPVVIVDINQKDFEEMFQAQSRPLNPPRLHELITAIATGKPCLIGVDIDTSFSQFDEKHFVVASDWPAIVWLRETKEVPKSIEQTPVPLDVLGGRSDFNRNSGLALMIEDASGVTRRYRRLFETKDGTVPSFAWAVYLQARKCSGLAFPDLPTNVDTKPLLIKYSRPDSVGRNVFAASHLRKLAQNDRNWPDNELIKGKIVLVGGTYLDEDQHDTPLGEMSGVAINANVIETELSGGGIEPPGFLLVALLSLFDGLLLIGLFHIFPGRKAIWYSVPVILVLSLFCSWLTYDSLAQWPLFALVMIGAVIAEWFDNLKESLKKDYGRSLKGLYSRLTGQKNQSKNSSSTQSPP